MTSKSITAAVSSNGKKTLGDLGQGIKKLHVNYDKQLKNAKTRGKLRQVFQKHRRDHQNLLKKHLKTRRDDTKETGDSPRPRRLRLRKSVFFTIFSLFFLHIFYKLLELDYFHVCLFFTILVYLQ